MITKKTHRRYPNHDWDYKAISTIINDNNIKRNIIYHILISDGEKIEGVEIYAGSNYLVDSHDRNYSRRYDFNNTPVKYRNIVNELKKIHITTKWSSKKYVNEN